MPITQKGEKTRLEHGPLLKLLFLGLTSYCSKLRHEVMAVELASPLPALPAALERRLGGSEALLETSKCIYFYF